MALLSNITNVSDIRNHRLECSRCQLVIPSKRMLSCLDFLVLSVCDRGGSKLSFGMLFKSISICEGVFYSSIMGVAVLDIRNLVVQEVN